MRLNLKLLIIAIAIMSFPHLALPQSFLGNGKVDPILLMKPSATTTFLKPLSPQQLNTAPPDSRRFDTVGRVQIDVHFDCASKDIQQLLSKTGMKVDVVVNSPPLCVVEGWAENAILLNLSALSAVRSIQVPTYAIPRGKPLKPTSPTGSIELDYQSAPAVSASATPINGNGITIMRTDQFISQTGKNGSGVKVGVMSDNITNISTIQSRGELPTVTNLSSLAGSTSPPAGDEGTMMLQLIYAAASGAELYFCSPYTSTLYVSCINQFIANGISIAVDDIQYFPTAATDLFTPDSSTYSQSILNIQSANPGLILMSSAGNNAQAYWQGSYSPSSLGTYLYCSASGRYNYYVNNFSGYLYNNWSVPSGGFNGQIFLQWSDAAGTSNIYNDFDLFIRDQYGNFSCITKSYVGNNFVSYNGPVSAGLYQIYIASPNTNYSGKSLKLFISGGYTQLGIPVSGGFVSPQTMTTGVLNVGAVNGGDAIGNTLETFSNTGPITYQYPSPASVLAPNLVAPDNVYVDTVGTLFTASNFTGTSAAAPNAAAVFALLRSAYPSLSAAQLKTAIQNGAGTLGGTKPNYSFGYGRVDAIGALSTLTSNQTISFSSSAPAAVVGGATYTPTATSTSGLSVTITIDAASASICSISGGVVSFIGAGTCVINANQPGNWQYFAASQVQQLVTVSKSNQTITWSQTLSGSFGGTLSLTATASSGLPVTYTSGTATICTVNGTTLTLIAIGTCSVTASQAGNTNWNAATSISQSFTVAKGNQTITWSQSLYGSVGGSISLTATASSGLAVTYTSGTATICTVNGTTLTLIAIGTCSVTASQVGNTNWNAATSISQSFTVAKGNQTITWSQSLSGSVGGSISLTATASSGLAVTYTSGTATICAVSGSALSLLAGGTCTVTAAQVGNTNWNAATSITRSFSVTVTSISLLAGAIDGPGFLNGTGTAARFFAPTGIAIDASNNLYVTDTNNSVIRKITSAGVVSTLAGAVLTPGAVIGTATAAQFNKPTGIGINGTSLVIADTGNQLVRAMTTAGAVTALAGTASAAGSADGTGTAARFNNPQGVAVDTSNNAFIADTSNSTIRKVTTTGVTTTFAGTALSVGGTNATGTAARFNNPIGIGRDGANNLYVADAGGQTVRKVTTGAVVTTLAGTYSTAGTVDGTGAAARFSTPSGATVDSSGNIFVSDANNDTIRKITATGVVTTFAGSAGLPGSVDGTGTAARFYRPVGMARDSVNNLFVADPVSHTIRKVTPTGGVSTFAGYSAIVGANDNATGSLASFRNPSGMVADASGNLYVADTGNHTIRKTTSVGAVTTFAGTAGTAGNADGTGAAARFNSPSGLAIDSAGNLYVADTGNHTIRKITSAGVVTTIAGTAASPGSADAVGSAARFKSPAAVAVFNATPALLYVADTGNYTIRKIDLSTSTVTTLAGSAGLTAATDGTGTAARFGLIYGLGVNSTGTNIYAADFTNQTVRQITSAGVVTTFAGAAGTRGSINATGASARFSSPYGLTIDASNNIYVGDYGNCLLRKITAAAVVTSPVGTVGTCKFVAANAPSTINSPIGLSKVGTTLYFTAGNGVAMVANMP